MFVFDFSQTEVSEVCGSAVSLAQQLTHIELERLSYIGPEEFVQAYINEGNAPSLGTDFEPRITTNFEVYVGWTNRLSRLVVTDVCRVSTIFLIFGRCKSSLPPKKK